MEPISANAQHVGDAAVDLLIEAGVVLARSLDLPTTMEHVAQLTVPRLADLCVIDTLDDSGLIRGVAAAAEDERVALAVRQMRARHPLDQAGAHPVARVIATGEPLLLSEMTSGMLRTFSQGEEHAQLMIDHAYRSAVVAPLLARGRTLGALSVLRLGDGLPYGQEDLGILCELARRAALAIDNARLFGDLQRLERRLEAILANLAEAITVTDERGRMVFANQAAARLFGTRTPTELLHSTAEEIRQRSAFLDEQGQELDIARATESQLFAGERPAPLLVRLPARPSGQERWLTVRCSPIIDPSSQRVQYAVNVFEDITEIKRIQLSESFMAEASSMLASSMDYRASLRRVAELATPQIADAFVAYLLDDEGAVEVAAAHHVQVDKRALTGRLGLCPPQAGEPNGVLEVIGSGHPHIYTELEPGRPAAGGDEDEHLRLLRAIGTRAGVIVPMLGATQAIGAIGLFFCESPKRPSSADLSLAERLGRRAGTAVEHARLYAERTRIANTLQEALLPESLPELPHAEVHALYCAASGLNEVGGDFYDVFEYGQSRWMLVIGDVCGKGPRAAGVTALARHTLRAAAMSGQTPRQMLITLHQALRRQPSGADLCTVCLVSLTPAPGRAKLTVTLAGHPQPLLIGESGAAEAIGRPGTLLGMITPIVIDESEHELLYGETLLLYTDGVTDVGQSEARLGEEGLRELASLAPQLTLERLLKHIEQSALAHTDGRSRDDIALLALRPRKE